MAKKIKVLMVVVNLSVANGVSSYVMNYFRAIDHEKIHMDFVIYQDINTPYYDEIQAKGSRIFILPSLRDIQLHMKAAEKVIVDGQYDIIHDNILLPSYFIMYYAKKHNVSVRILHSHSSRLSGSKLKALRNRIFLPLLLNTTTNRIACSKAAAEGMFCTRDCPIIPNVVSAQKYSFNLNVRSEIRHKMNAEQKLVLGSVGRMAVEKNPIFAIQVVIEAKRTIPNLEYWWIGDGPLMQKAKDFVATNHAEKYIKLLGNRSDVYRFYQAMDIFFLPSFFEGLPVTGLEAQAAGLPCIVSDTISDEFVYTDLVHFFSLSKGSNDVVNVAKEIMNQVHDRTIYSQQLLASKFSDQNAGKMLLRIYQDFLNR